MTSPTPSVLLQAGHSKRFIPYIPGGGGAPGEADWTGELATRLAAILTQHNVPTTVVGSWATPTSAPPYLIVHPAPPEVTRFDYSLFVSLHYNGSPTNPLASGCGAGHATLDPSRERADAFINTWAKIYPALTHLPLDPSVSASPNVTGYYAFRDSTDNTPGVLIEHGYGAQGDYNLLHNSIDLIAEADARAILAHLGIAYSPPPQPPSPPDQLTLYAEALRLANWQKHEMEAYIVSPEHRASVDDAALQEGNPPVTLMLRWAQDHFDAGETAP